MNLSGLSFLSSIPSATQSAQLGIARGIAGLNQDAQVVAQSATGSGDDLTAALVDASQEKLAVAASAQVLSASDEMLGTLLDVKA